MAKSAAEIRLEEAEKRRERLLAAGVPPDGYDIYGRPYWEDGPVPRNELGGGAIMTPPDGWRLPRGGRQ